MKLIEEMKKALPPHVPVQRVRAWANTLANSGALVPVRIEPKPGEHADWYMTPAGLGCLAYDLRGHEYIDTPGHIYGVSDADCYPVRLVPIAEWEAEG